MSLISTDQYPRSGRVGFVVGVGAGSDAAVFVSGGGGRPTGGGRMTTGGGGVRRPPVVGAASPSICGVGALPASVLVTTAAGTALGITVSGAAGAVLTADAFALALLLRDANTTAPTAATATSSSAPMIATGRLDDGCGADEKRGGLASAIDVLASGDRP